MKIVRSAICAALFTVLTGLFTADSSFALPNLSKRSANVEIKQNKNQIKVPRCSKPRHLGYPGGTFLPSFL